MSEPGDLIRRCVQILQAFNPAVDTVDVHADRFLGPDPGKVRALPRGSTSAAETRVVPLSHPPSLIPPSPTPYSPQTTGVPDPDYTFVRQVFYGVNRMERAVRVVLNALYHVHAASLNRGHATLIQVLVYLVVFRAAARGGAELSMRKLAVLLESQEPATVQTVVGFLFDRAAVAEWVREGWCKFLDRGYVEETLLGGLDALRPEAEAWLDGNRTKAFGHHNTGTGRSTGGAGGAAPIPGSAAAPKRAPTVPVAPKLTQPKPRTAPEPVRIPQAIKAVPVPAWIESTTLEEIERRQAEVRARTHVATRNKYHFESTVPRLHETRNTRDALREELEATRAAEMAPLPPARPPPRLPATGADVKLNAAAILREDAVIKGKQEKEAAVIRDFERNLRDTTDYFAWQEAERAKDEEARLFAVAARKKEADDAAVVAAAALAAQQAAARAVARDMKAASAVVAEHLTVEKEAEVASRRRLAEQVRTVEYVLPAQARAAVAAAKHEQHDRVRDESVAAEVAIADARKREAAEKVEVLRQIRALERVPHVQIKTFDPSAPSGVGMLGEMSLVELRERLALMRRRDDEQVEEKRREILRDKREREEMLLARVANIQRMRAQAAESNAVRRHEAAESKEDEEARQARRREEAMLVLSEQLAARRAERDEARRLLEEEEARRVKAALFLGAQTTENEARRLDSRQQGMERGVRHEQQVALRGKDQALAVAAKEARMAEVRAAEAAARAVADAQDVKRAVAEATREEHAFRLAETARKKQLFFEAADREMALADLRDSLNEYAATVRHTDQDTARARRGGLPVPAERAETLSRRLARLPNGHPLAATMSMRITQGAVAGARSGVVAGGRGGR
jgi:hypothetical protein